MAASGRQTPVKFLLAVDGSNYSDAAVRWLAGLKSTGLGVHGVLLNVQPPIMSGEVGSIAPVSVAEEAHERKSIAALDPAAALLREAGVDVTLVREAASNIAEALLACAAAHGCEAIVLGRRGRGPLRAALFGSVSAAVVQRASVPVILVNAQVPPLASAPLRILLATDGSAAANRAAAFAGSMAARAANAEVHVLHVRPDSTIAEAVFGPKEQLLEQWSGGNEGEAIDSARNVVVNSGAACHVFPAIAGDAHAIIQRTAGEIGCGMIALGTRGLRPVSAMLAGSVAQQVVQHAVVPVLLAK
jgi:nucleotide-binding universal stress UspA family protein